MKKIVYIDMDGVCADFEKAIRTLCPELDVKDGADYEARSVLVKKVCADNPDIFHNLEPIEGSIEAINALLDSPYYEVYFLSTPLWELPESYAGKRIWLWKHFGDKVKDRLILSQRKDLSIGDYLIDDTTRNGAGEFTGDRIHYGTEKYPTWKEVSEYLTICTYFRNIDQW